VEGRREGEGRGEGGRQGGDWPRGIDATQTDRHNVIFPDCDIPWRYPPNQTGSGLRVSASFQRIPDLVGRLRSGVWVSASFLIFSKVNLWQGYVQGRLSYEFDVQADE